jgi:putative oxygen-independent coproporphyrinogen III oxidase
VHWPFCKSKCPYCDFNSHVRESIDQDSWLNAYIKELEYYKDILHGRKITSLFFGGGTPSLAEPRVIEAIINKIAVAADTEITMEANPTSVEAERFAQYAKAGVNRVSIGVQSFRPEQLKFLGREHSGEEATKAIDLAQKYFPRYSFDLIYSLPEQSLADWQKELEFALSLTNGHLSLYQLTIEKGTRFFSDHKRKLFSMPDDDRSAEAFTLTNAIMEAHQMPGYEVSNYASFGQECQHNLNYWRYGDYLGIGPGAHGRYTNIAGAKLATIDHHSPEEWLNSIGTNGHGLKSEIVLTTEEVHQETILMGIRLREGIAASLVEDKDKLAFLEGQGLILLEQGNIKATAQGRLLLNRLVAELFDTTSSS